MRFIYISLPILLLSITVYGQTTEPITLGEVTVKAKNIITTPDKTTIIPTSQIKKHSFDGYTMLSLMNIPELNVNIFDNTIGSNDGTAILICINGVEASNEEIKALNPKYVRKIDYYTNFDPRHPEANRVLDFILKTRDSGGELMIRADQHLNLLEGDDMAYWKLFSGNTEVALSIKDNYKKYKNGIGSIERTVMKFPTREIIKNSNSLPSLQRDNGVGGSATILHRFDNALFKAGVALNNAHTIDDSGDQISYEGPTIPNTESHTYTHKDMTYSSLKIQYDQGFKNKSILSFSISGGYNHTDGLRDYTSLEQFHSNTNEKYYTLNPNISYTIPFMDKKLSVFAKINHYYTRSNQEYTENGVVSDQIFTNNETLLQLGANIKFIKNLSATVRLQDRILYKSSTGVNESSNKHTFTPSIILSYRLPNGDRISTFWSTGLFSPELSYFSTAEKRLDEFQVLVGNPNLRLEGILDGRLSYSHYFSWGSISPELLFTRRFHPVYQTYTCDAERELYVRTYLNGGNSTNFNPHIYTNIIVIPNRFNMWLNVGYKYRQIHTYTAITKQCATGEAGLTYMNNGLSGEVSCSLPWKDLMENGLYVKRPIELKVNLSYIFKDWSFSIMAKNPLYKVKHSYTYSLPSGFSEQNRAWTPRAAYNYFEARIGYRFSYGKKHKFQNVDLDNRAGSAILGF